MSLSPPNLHVFHPAGRDDLVAWLARIEAELGYDPEWDRCQLRRVQYDSQAFFDAATQSDFLRRLPGPCVVIQPVQQRCLNKLISLRGADTIIHALMPTSYVDLLALCSDVRLQFGNGEPLFGSRLITAFLIIKKLHRHNFWGGCAKFKDYLWGGDLAKGGFPKGVLDVSEINDVAEVLLGRGVLKGKISKGDSKFALVDKGTVEKILRTRTFEERFRLERYFGQSPRMLSHKYFEYND